MPSGTLITWTLTGTYLAHGIVTGYEYETIPGIIVTATNLRTGEHAAATTDDGGEYAVDLGDLTAFPSGYATGDEIQLDVTHRGATRTWKRRVASDEIVQDLYFTHGTAVGALRRAGMVVADVFTNVSGSVLTFRDGQARDVIQVRKNGEILAPTEWAFTLPQTVTLTSPASTSDVFEVERSIYRSVTEAKDDVVREGEGQVRNSVARYYPTPLPNRVPELQELSETLTAARLRDLTFTGADKPDAAAASMRKYAKERLDELREGVRGLTDVDGAWITPIAQATTTPQAAPQPIRQFPPFSSRFTRKEI